MVGLSNVCLVVEVGDVTIWGCVVAVEVLTLWLCKVVLKFMVIGNIINF